MNYPENLLIRGEVNLPIQAFFGDRITPLALYQRRAENTPFFDMERTHGYVAAPIEGEPVDFLNEWFLVVDKRAALQTDFYVFMEYFDWEEERDRGDAPKEMVGLLDGIEALTNEDNGSDALPANALTINFLIRKLTHWDNHPVMGIESAFDEEYNFYPIDLTRSIHLSHLLFMPKTNVPADIKAWLYACAYMSIIRSMVNHFDAVQDHAAVFCHADAFRAAFVYRLQANNPSILRDANLHGFERDVRAKADAFLYVTDALMRDPHALFSIVEQEKTEKAVAEHIQRLVSGANRVIRSIADKK